MYGFEHQGQRANVSEVFFRIGTRQNEGSFNLDIESGKAGCFISSLSLLLLVIEIFCRALFDIGEVLVGKVEDRRLEPNLIRRSSLSRALSTSSEGGC